MKKNIQVYIHIPFCIKHCRYCTACTVTGDSASKALYLDALKKELEDGVEALEGYRVTSVYVGGGSPSVMRPDDLAKLIHDFKDSIDVVPHAETTVELMPQTVGTPSLTGLSHGGFTRFSLSMQSAVASELEALDCGFDICDVQNAILFLDRFRMNEVNIDIMYGIPGQTKKSMATTLHAVRDFRPTHVSLYPFPEAGVDDGNHDAELQEAAVTYLESMGFHRYTKFHFAQKESESRYFIDRYTGLEYMGFGLGARSFVDGIFYENTADWQEYLDHAGSFETLIAHAWELDDRALQEYRVKASKLLIA